MIPVLKSLESDVVEYNADLDANILLVWVVVRDGV